MATGTTEQSVRAISDEPDLLHELIHHVELPETAFSRGVDRLLRVIGSTISWIWVLLVAIIITNVTMRYLLGEGRIEFEEIQWHLYSIGFLLGLSYCMESDDHVRVDVLYERFSLRTKAWVELFGILLLLMPFLFLVLRYSVPFFLYSWSTGEVSEAPGGLPARWAIKSFLFIGFGFLLVAACSRLSRVTAYLFGRPTALPPAATHKET
ncbi:TRAP transporter small permease subunit [Sedimenticola sp.]|uniref:TRAP transporter small permease subunit n=1 Tax=Sedimenticola sp. TaxID=1940285 RepID=UPI003D132D7E